MQWKVCLCVGGGHTREQFATYFPPVITQEVSLHNLCWNPNIHRKTITLNHIFLCGPAA